ncbi:MAG: hypothetical protein IKM33_07240, partial [Clostridia bacterium]|nr:hypothetical protein [Clostridia bacterium]
RDISTSFFVDIHPSGVRYTADAVRYAAVRLDMPPTGREGFQPYKPQFESIRSLILRFAFRILY